MGINELENKKKKKKQLFACLGSGTVVFFIYLLSSYTLADHFHYCAGDLSYTKIWPAERSLCS